MKPVRITENLIQLTRFGFINAYLVREEDGFTLVDTAMRAADDLLAAARQVGGEIRRIAVTHGHGDHVGSLDALRERLGPTVPVLIPAIDARILAGDRDGYGKLPGSWPKLQTVPDVRLAPGERVGSLEVVPSPGHTPGHVAFLDTRDQTLIAGDVFTAFGGLEVSDHVHWRFPLAGPATWNGVRDLESARALRALEPSVLVVGHGPAVRSPVTAMDGAIARRGG